VLFLSNEQVTGLLVKRKIYADFYGKNQFADRADSHWTSHLAHLMIDAHGKVP
jgi:hypothetical protein